jgi:NAD dependent epimerase/dehydratase family enzyme
MHCVLLCARPARIFDYHDPGLFWLFLLPGFYGASENATFSEASGSGRDYLAEVCRDWEAEALKAKSGRTVILRTGAGAASRHAALLSLWSQCMQHACMHSACGNAGRVAVSCAHCWERLGNSASLSSRTGVARGFAP